MPDASEPPRSVLDEILAGLSAGQKTLPAKLFYDEAGCALFNRITSLPEYYVTRAEMALLGRHAAEIAAHAPPGAALMPAAPAAAMGGAGRAPGRRDFAAYVPVDIAGPALAAIAARMRRTHPGLPVVTVVADFLQPLALPPSVARLPPFGFFPGSTIGNFRPPMVGRFLRAVRDTLSGVDAPWFVVGTDLRKDPSRLLPAYDDGEGVTAAFNRNILRHVNRIAPAGFDPDAFDHRAVWNAQEGRIEMHLQSRHAQAVEVGGRVIRFRAGETIHTEDSYKHTPDGFLALAAEAGWRSAGFWSDPDGLFGMHLLRG